MVYAHRIDCIQYARINTVPIAERVYSTRTHSSFIFDLIKTDNNDEFPLSDSHEGRHYPKTHDKLLYELNSISS